LVGLPRIPQVCCKVCCVDKLCAGCKDCLCKQGPLRGAYDGMVMLACVTKESLPRAMQGKLDQEDLGVALEVQLTLAFMQLGGELGGRVVHTGREKFLGELSPKLGKPKKHPAYCIYLAYRLERGGIGEERGGDGEISGERAPGSATPSSLQWEGEEEDDDEANQVMEELEDKQLLGRLTMVEQENKELRELVARLEHGRSWLEQRVGALEGQLGSDPPHFAAKINSAAAAGQDAEEKTAK